MNLQLFLGVVISALVFSGCAEEEKSVFQRYDGPEEEIFDVGVKYSEGGKVTVAMTTPSQLRFTSGNKVFPDSVNIVFYDTLGTVTTTIRSDSGRFDNAKNIYTVIGNVIVNNIQEREYLYTSELNWNPGTRKVSNDKANRILQIKKGTVLNGIGLDAKQDFTDMNMIKITGIVPFDDGAAGMPPAPAAAPVPSVSINPAEARKDTAN